VYRLVGERGAAEDLTQEVFLKVHRAAHQLDPSRDPGPWLTAIAYNACRDFWRSSAYRMRARSGSIEADPALAARLTRGTNDPERDLLSEERRELVLRAIQSLPELLRVAVVLHEYEGLSHEQIAKMTGINHAAARKRYSRALEALGKMLREVLG
jgi:RNA polymerase sigma-70 factor (ECF subfamily)